MSEWLIRIPTLFCARSSTLAGENGRVELVAARRRSSDQTRRTEKVFSPAASASPVVGSARHASPESRCSDIGLASTPSYFILLVFRLTNINKIKIRKGVMRNSVMATTHIFCELLPMRSQKDTPFFQKAISNTQKESFFIDFCFTYSSCLEPISSAGNS
jgi:hypothetical protein